MTSGIYQLKFGPETYIGKSVDIERRWEEHAKNLDTGKASQRMQAAYRRWGAGEPSILIECHPDHIDLLETIMIWHLKPTINSAGTVKVNSEDVVTLCENEDLLKYSTGTHLRTIRALESTQAKLARELRELKDSNVMVARLADYKDTVDLLSERLVEMQEKLRRAEMPWWKKLF